ncbi:MAG: hypothetical protein WKF81_07030 [Thermomicrobiales bacterium]
MRTRWFAVIAATLALVFGMSMQTLAQDSTPAMDNDNMAMDAGRPAHVHVGTCDAVGDVVIPLNNASAADSMTDAATPEVTSVATPGAAGGEETSSTVAEVPLADIIAGGHIVNVHESVEAIDIYVACGAVQGEVVDNVLTVALDEQNDSGLTGTAVFTDNGDGTTTIDLTISGGTEGTPEASPIS